MPSIRTSEHLALAAVALGILFGGLASAKAETVEAQIAYRQFKQFMAPDAVFRQEVMTDAFSPFDATVTVTGDLERERPAAMRVTDVSEETLSRQFDQEPRRPTFGFSYAF